METKLQLFSELKKMGLEDLKKVLAFSKKLNKPFNQEEFDTFWKDYPRKVGKPNAIKSWKKLNPKLDIVLASLTEHKNSEQWQNQSFIPHASTWLNREGWNDQVIKKTEFKDLPLNEQKIAFTNMSPLDRMELRKNNVQLYCRLTI